MSQVLGNMNTFTPHPSVRVKGTEANFNASTCTDPSCVIKNLHMHCPFCVKTDSYQDPVILKMHYRVKHVDKGIDFAGLKVLRCCDRCDIVGAIKGEKIFKGAHWHCYRCRNGFNRRDEAIKHYRTHFRNPETTFQIQISQIEEGEGLHCQDTDTDSIANGTRRITASTPQKTSHELVSVAANETVGSSEQTIMIIQDSNLDSNNSAIEGTYTVIPNHEYADESGSVECVLGELPAVSQQQSDDEDKFNRFEARLSSLENENALLRKEVFSLRNKLDAQSKELKQSEKERFELQDQLNVPLDKNILELLTKLEKTHSELMQDQLSLLRRNYLNQLNKENHTITIPTDALQNAVLESQSGSVCITIQRRREILGGGMEGSIEGSDGIPTATFEVQQISDETSAENSPAVFNEAGTKVLDSDGNTVLELMDIPVTQQQQLSVTEAMGEPFDVNCTTAAVTLPTSVSPGVFSGGLQPVVITSDSYGFTSAQDIQVVESSGDLSSSEMKEDEPPTKRSKTD